MFRCVWGGGGGPREEQARSPNTQGAVRCRRRLPSLARSDAQPSVQNAGHGELHYVNGDVFRGDWKNDFACGHGELNYANGDSYSGSWLNDRRHGQGKFTSAQDGKVCISYRWRLGRLCWPVHCES